LSVLETIARHQPIGLAALAKMLSEDKSAVQRAIATLASDGWIGLAAESPPRWELSARVFTVAHMGQSNNDLRKRARGALEALRDETGESALLAVPDTHHFVVVDVIESRHVLRTSTAVGTIVPLHSSATGRAVLPFLSRAKQIEILGEEPGPALLDEYKAIRKRGYSVSTGTVFPGATSIAAAIFEADGRPIGAIAITGPTERLSLAHHTRLGSMVITAARNLSRGVPIQMI
jgi:IclR family acetate operon transcriptional repressor